MPPPDGEVELSGLQTAIETMTLQIQRNTEKAIELKAEIKTFKKVAESNIKFLQKTLTSTLSHERKTMNKVLDWAFKIGIMVLMAALGLKSFGVI